MAIIIDESSGGLVINIEVDGEASQLGQQKYDYGDLRDTKLLDKARGLFDSGMDLVEGCARKVITTIDSLPDQVRPNAMEVKLAVKLDVDVGAVLAKVGSEAQLEVTMKWTS